jgi:flagellar biosynthesis/type III secretory pathway protein FliH
MGEIVITVPKRRKRVQIIKSEDALNDFLEKRTEQIKKQFYIEDEVVEETIEDEIVEEIKIITDEGIEDLEEEDLPIEKEEEVIFNVNLIEEQKEISNKYSTEIIDTENIYDNKIMKDVEHIELEDPKNDTENKIIFTEIYTISDNNEPIQITTDIENQIKNQNKNLIDAEFFEKNIQESYDKGYRDAQEVALLNAREKIIEIHSYIRRIDNFMLELRKHYSEQLIYTKNKIIEIGKNVAEVILDDEINNNENVVIKQIEKVFAEINNEKVFEIRINPADYAVLNEIQSNLIKPNNNTIEFIIDNNIERGSCILNTALGNIDATIKKQLNKLIAEINIIEKEKLPTADELIVGAVPDITIVSEELLAKEEENTVGF